ncbi:MAG TPA: DUF5719 family protein [Acidimicrobiales bacterium]|nr:DUF5719 family protein [Acidimicrobiales bacterium]
MRSGRLAPLVVLGGLLAAGLLYEASEPEEPVDLAPALQAGVALPTARAEPTLSSTWYCAGGTAAEGGLGDHVVVIANPTDRPRTAVLTVLTGPITEAAAPVEDAAPVEGAGTTTTTAPPTTTTTAPPTSTTEAPPPTQKAVDLPAQSRVEVRLADLVQAPLAGAVVEVDGGDVSVEHHITGDLGRATAPCSTTASSSWSFPWGVTTRGNRELLVFMNPFPDDATVDITFATDEGVRQPARFEGFIVPGRSVVGAWVDQDARRAQVSADIQVRHGRLVIDRIQTFDGTDGRTGMTLGLGVPTPAETWVFPAGQTGDGLLEQVVVFNPTEEVAEVEVDARLDDPGEAGPPEPFELTIPPGRYSTVDVHAEDRVPPGVGHALIVRSLNGVPVAAERVNAANEPAANKGITSTTGSPFGGRTWYFPSGGPSTADGRDEVLVLLNLSNDEEVSYDVAGFSGGQTIAIEGLQDQTLAPGGRAVIRLGDHIDRADLPVVVTASGAVVVERGLYRIGGLGISQSIGIPSATGLVVPEALNL